MEFNYNELNMIKILVVQKLEKYLSMSIELQEMLKSDIEDLESILNKINSK